MKTALPESVPSDKIETTTVWSFPERGKWSTHSAKYRGNWAPQIARNLILLYSQEGDTVLDPMVGSGTTMIEAKLLGRKGIGLDIHPEVVEIAQKACDFLTANGAFQPKLYKNLLDPKGVDYKKFISKKLLPDDAIFIISNNTLFVVEIKFQEVPGSVDEKLQTCDFKNKQYQKLLSPIGIKVKYVYVLNEWFGKKEYKDVLEFVTTVGCHHFFPEIPLDFLGLPRP